MAERVRTTISLDPEVLKIFQEMADAAGISVSRCMGEWLADTQDGARLIAQKMQEARRAPMAVMREMQAMLRGAEELADATVAELREEAVGRGSASAARARQALPAPSSNTGRNSPGKGRGRS